MKSFLTRLLYGGTSRLRNYESFCIDSFKDRLSSEAGMLVETQIKAVDLIQRFSQDKLVVFHFLKGDESALPLFPNRLPEFRVARVVIQSTSSHSEIRCDVVFHRGKLSSLEFSRPPKSLTTTTLRCERVEIFEDLMQEPSVTEKTPLTSGKTKILDEIRSKLPVSDILPPVTEIELKKFLNRLSTTVPEDYVQLLHETNGFSVNGWRFYGTKARKLVQSDSNYWLIMEKGGKALCFREDTDSPIVLSYDQVNDEVSEVGKQFIDSLMKVAGNTDSRDT